MIASDKIKKILLAGFVVVSYALYSYSQQHDTTSAVIPPSTTTQSPTDTNNNASNTAPNTSNPATNSTFKDGSFTGSVADAFYGNIQVKAIIHSGKITDVVFLQYPNDRANSIRINNAAMPLLKQEAIQAQSAQVDIITGATDTSIAFRESMSSALTQANK